MVTNMTTTDQDPALVQGMHQCRDTILNTVRAGFDNALVQVFSSEKNESKFTMKYQLDDVFRW